MSETAAASLIVVIGTYATATLGRALYLAAASRRWPKADGVVDDSEVVVGDVSHRRGPVNLEGSARVVYAYFAGGRLRYGTRIQFGPEWWWFAGSEVRRYPPGSRVPVAYDARDPDRCVLRPGVTWSIVICLPPAAFLLMLGLTWFVRSLA